MTGAPVNFHRTPLRKHSSRNKTEAWGTQEEKLTASIYIFGLMLENFSSISNKQSTGMRWSWWVKKGLKTLSVAGGIFTWEIEGSPIVHILHQKKKMVNTITGESSLLSGKSRKNGNPRTRLVWPDSELPAACHPSGQLQLVSAPSLGPFSGPGTVMIDRADSGVRWPRDTVCKPSYLLCEMRPSSFISTKGLEPTLGWQTGLFPTPCPGTSLWDLDIEHGRTVDTAETANAVPFRTDEYLYQNNQ